MCSGHRCRWFALWQARAGAAIRRGRGYVSVSCSQTEPSGEAMYSTFSKSAVPAQRISSQPPGKGLLSRQTHLVKRPRVGPAALPHLVDGPLGVRLGFAVRVGLDRQDRASPHAGLGRGAGGWRWRELAGGGGSHARGREEMKRRRVDEITWCCFVKFQLRLVNSRPKRQSPDRFSARILRSEARGDRERISTLSTLPPILTCSPQYTHAPSGPPPSCRPPRPG